MRDTTFSFRSGDETLQFSHEACVTYSLLISATVYFWMRFQPHSSKVESISLGACFKGIFIARSFWSCFPIPFDVETNLKIPGLFSCETKCPVRKTNSLAAWSEGETAHPGSSVGTLVEPTGGVACQGSGSLGTLLACRTWAECEQWPDSPSLLKGLSALSCFCLVPSHNKEKS